MDQVVIYFLLLLYLLLWLLFGPCGGLDSGPWTLSLPVCEFSWGAGVSSGLAMGDCDACCIDCVQCA